MNADARVKKAQIFPLQRFTLCAFIPVSVRPVFSEHRQKHQRTQAQGLWTWNDQKKKKVIVISEKMSAGGKRHIMALRGSAALSCQSCQHITISLHYSLATCHSSSRLSHINTQHTHASTHAEHVPGRVQNVLEARIGGGGGGEKKKKAYRNK